MNSGWLMGSLLDDDRHWSCEIYHLLLVSGVDQPPEPVFPVWLSAVVHHPHANLHYVVGMHAKTSVRFGRSERSDVGRSVDVVVGILEEDLHDLHWIFWISRIRRTLVACPLRIGRNPARIPGELSDLERAARSWIRIFAVGYVVHRYDRIALVYIKDLVGEVGHELHRHLLFMCGMAVVRHSRRNRRAGNDSDECKTSY